MGAEDPDTDHDGTLKQVEDAWGWSATIDGSTAAAFQSVGSRLRSHSRRQAGRHAFADGTLSPMCGADKKGPTAVLNSIGKIPYMHSQLLNQRFMPQFLEGENKKLFAAYLGEWHAKGTIPHIQFNVVDTQVLRDAQEHPEKYTDLQVRVAGYSAFWIDLAPETQDASSPGRSSPWVVSASHGHRLRQTGIRRHPRSRGRRIQHPAFLPARRAWNQNDGLPQGMPPSPRVVQQPRVTEAVPGDHHPGRQVHKVRQVRQACPEQAIVVEDNTRIVQWEKCSHS